MRFLIGSILIVAAILALGMLVSTYKETSQQLAPTAMVTPSISISPTEGQEQGLILTPIALPTLSVKESAFEEKWVKVESQDVVYFVPKNILPNQQLTLVIYSHGSAEKIDVNDDSNEVLAKLRNSAQDLSGQAIILAASNLHGENWGSSESVEDIGKVIDFLSGEYSLLEKVDLWGFSMGALPVMLYATQKPESIEKIALFAPTVDLDYWTPARIDTIKNIPIKIWHGSDDKNVPYQSSQDFLQRLLVAGVPMEFETVEGAGHFDLEDVEGLLEFLRK